MRGVIITDIIELNHIDKVYDVKPDRFNVNIDNDRIVYYDNAHRIKELKYNRIIIIID